MPLLELVLPLLRVQVLDAVGLAGDGRGALTGPAPAEAARTTKLGGRWCEGVWWRDKIVNPISGVEEGGGLIANFLKENCATPIFWLMLLVKCCFSSVFKNQPGCHIN